MAAATRRSSLRARGDAERKEAACCGGHGAPGTILAFDTSKAVPAGSRQRPKGAARLGWQPFALDGAVAAGEERSDLGRVGWVLEAVAAKVEVPQLHGGYEPLRERPTESVAGKAELFQLVEEGAAAKSGQEGRIVVTGLSTSQCTCFAERAACVGRAVVQGSHHNTPGNQGDDGGGEDDAAEAASQKEATYDLIVCTGEIAAKEGRAHQNDGTNHKEGKPRLA